MKQESTVDLLLDVDQRPSDGKGILLSFQHVFAMFGATILVPLILGMPVSVALFASGVGTLIYMIATGFKVPVYLGSSFAFITAMSLAMKEMGGDVSAAQTGVILTGLVYVLVATSIRFVGTKWIDKLLPPIIIGPMIIVIGMTRIASVSVIRNAAFIAIALSFLGKFTALISTIPNAVLGGMSILLYGVIASNGLKVLIKERVDFAQMRNLIIASAMLVLGLGGAILKLGPVTLSGTALSAMTGIILNLILPYENKD